VWNINMNDFHFMHPIEPKLGTDLDISCVVRVVIKKLYQYE
jgi:hypothetical protein